MNLDAAHLAAMGLEAPTTSLPAVSTAASVRERVASLRLNVLQTTVHAYNQGHENMDEDDRRRFEGGLARYGMMRDWQNDLVQDYRDGP
ncbi:hypothetical protein FLONG3_11396, partial [Fusarium longipes]